MAGKNYRDAKNGQFVTKATATRRPTTTLAENRDGGQTGRERDTKSGRFVPDGTARHRPSTTVREDYGTKHGENLDQLHRHRRRFAAADAKRGDAARAAARLQRMEKRD